MSRMKVNHVLTWTWKKDLLATVVVRTQNQGPRKGVVVRTHTHTRSKTRVEWNGERAPKGS